MKKSQKIIGVLAFGAIGIYQLLVWINAYTDLKYIIEPYGISDIEESMYLRIDSLSSVMWLNYLISLALFICLWRKGDKQ